MYHSLTIDSRRLGKEIEFSTAGGSYIYVDLTGGDRPGTLGQQMCYGGSLFGSTISYSGASDAAFERICRRWWRAYLRAEG